VKAVELSERFKTRLLAIRPWCSVDARLGAATVALTETTVFDGEVHASDACDDSTGTLHTVDVTMWGCYWRTVQLLIIHIVLCVSSRCLHLQM
jgi:hypothetical protein